MDGLVAAVLPHVRGCDGRTLTIDDLHADDDAAKLLLAVAQKAHTPASSMWLAFEGRRGPHRATPHSTTTSVHYTY